VSDFVHYTAAAPCPICHGYGGGPSASRCIGGALGRAVFCSNVKSDRPSATGKTWRHAAPPGYEPPMPSAERAARSAARSEPKENWEPDRRNPTVSFHYPHEDVFQHYWVDKFVHPADPTRKTFSQRRLARYPERSSTGFVWRLKPIEPRLYRLPELRAARPCKVYCTEGEKDCDNVRAAGAVAVSHPGGVGKWHDNYSQELTGCEVFVIADLDPAPFRVQIHAYAVAESVKPYARSVVVVCGLEGKDATDHLDAGHTLDELIPCPHPGSTAESLKNAIRYVGDTLDYLEAAGDAFLVECPFCASRSARLDHTARFNCSSCSAEYSARHLLEKLKET